MHCVVQGCTTSMHLVAQGTKFCAMACNIFSTISVVIFLKQKNMYQFIHTKWKVPDTQVTPHYGTCFMSPFRILEFGGGLLIFYFISGRSGMCIQTFSYTELSLRNVGKLHLCSKHSNVLYTNETVITCASIFLVYRPTFKCIQLQYFVADTTA